MKTHFLTFIAVTTLSLIAAGCSSLPKDHVRLSSTSVFSHEDEQVWLLNIETEKSEKFRIQGQHFSIYGDTVKREDGNKLCTADVWLLGIYITYAERAYMKVIAQTGGATVTRTGEAGKGEPLTNVVNLTLPKTPVTHPLNRELYIGTWGNDEMRLMVGPGVYQPVKKTQGK